MNKPDPADIERALIREASASVPNDHLDGVALLNEVEAWLRRYVSYPHEAAVTAHALWIAHTHAMDAWYSTPRIAFLSPEPASGKTRALEVTEPLVPSPVQAVNVSPAYLFRKVSDDPRPTILFDEVDTVFGPKARENEDLRGLLNAGHRRGAVAGRCVVRGKIVETEELPAYAAVALAGLGNLPDTILSRAIVVPMRRRNKSAESVSQYRDRDDRPAGEALRKSLAEWIDSVFDELAAARPEMPKGVEDRAADVWEPLLAIAEAAGGNWPEKARVTAVTFVTASKDDTPSLGIRLLKDLKAAFKDENVLATTEILSRLHAIDEAPWNDLKGKPLDPRRLASLLHPYGIKSTTVRDGSVAKGYKFEDLYDVWERYLPSDSLPDNELHPLQALHEGCTAEELAEIAAEREAIEHEGCGVPT